MTLMKQTLVAVAVMTALFSGGALAQAAAVPAMVFFFAAIVTFVALGMFVPIVQIIDFVSPYKGSL